MRGRLIIQSGLLIALLLSPVAAHPTPDLLAATEAGRPPSFEDVLHAKFDSPDPSGFERLRRWAERPTPAERRRYMVKIGTGPDETAMWRDRVRCWEADRKGVIRAMVVAVGDAPDPDAARRVWAEAERVSASIPQVEADMLALAERDAASSPTPLAKALEVRHASDQAWRTAQFDRPHDDATSNAITWRVWSQACHADQDNLAYIKHIVATGAWPLISRDGAAAATNAFLLVQHADDDRDFQERVLALLETLVTRKEANGKSYAMLFDRIALARHRLQRYGTQFGSENACLAVLPVEDHATLDARRTAVGLEPLRDYARRLSETFHQVVCGDVFAVGTKTS